MARKLLVVGSGVSGLTVAYRARKLLPNLNVRVLEASDHIGGLIRTEQDNGYLVEHGPESILRAKPHAMRLAQELGLADQVQSTRQHVGGAFILHAGKLERIPAGFSLMAPGKLRPFLLSPLFSWPSKLRVLAEPWVRTRTSTDDESLAAFVRRRLGNQVLERIAQPMVSGIYGADPELLSLSASMPRFIDLERQHGSLVRGLRKQLAASGSDDGAAGARYKLFFSFQRGMQTLTDALAAKLGDIIETSCPVLAIERERDQWRVETQQGSIDTDALCLALPSPHAANLLEGCAPALSAELRAIPYGRGAAVTLAYDRRAIAHPLDAYGFVVPTVENTSVIACTFLHQKWEGRAPAGKALLRAFATNSDAELDKAALVRSVHDELSQWLEISAEPEHAWVSRYLPSTPHYNVGHAERVQSILNAAKELPGFYLTGNAYKGVGIPDSIALAEQTAQRIATT